MILIYWILFCALVVLCLPLQFINNIYFAPKIEKTDYSKYPELSLKSLWLYNHNYVDVFGGDAAKFIGMQYYCTSDYSVWNYLRDFFFDRENFVFVRYGYSELAFSGDQSSGMFMAITKAHINNHISELDKTFIGESVWRAIVPTLTPFRFKHNDLSRGWLLLPPICNGIPFLSLIMLKLGILFNSGYKKYVLTALYYMFLVPSLLLFLVGTFDRCLFWGRIYLFWTYSTHSDALVYRTAQLLGIPFAKWALKRTYNRHSYNLDISTLYLDSFSKEDIKSMSEDNYQEY